MIYMHMALIDKRKATEMPEIRKYEPGEYPEELETYIDPITGDMVPVDKTQRIPDPAALAKHVDILTKEVLATSMAVKEANETIAYVSARVDRFNTTQAKLRSSWLDDMERSDKKFSSVGAAIMTVTNATTEVAERLTKALEMMVSITETMGRFMDRLDLLESGLQYVEKRLPKETND